MSGCSEKAEGCQLLHINSHTFNIKRPLVLRYWLVKTFCDCSIRVFRCTARKFQSFYLNNAEGSKNLTKKHHAIKSNPYIDMITFIGNFPLVFPVPIFLEFLLTLFDLWLTLLNTTTTWLLGDTTFLQPYCSGHEHTRPISSIASSQQQPILCTQALL